MRFRIATQLVLVLAVLGLLTASISGGFIYRISRDLLVHSAENKLLTWTQVLSRRLVSSRHEVVNDLQILSGHPDTQAIIATPAHAGESKKRLSSLIQQLMEVHPAYHKIQLISASDHGLERLRVERRSTGVVLIEADELQEKGHYAYVSETLKQPRRAPYMSRISGRHEPAIDTDDRPTTLLSMPVFLPGKESAQGVIVITVDIRHEFSRLSEDIPYGLDLFLANTYGDILIHPDEAKTFGFDNGRRTLIQSEFPALGALINGTREQIIFATDANDQRAGQEATAQPRVAAFVRQGIEIASGDQWLYVGLSEPLSDILADSNQLERSFLRSMALVLPVCLAIAIFLAGIFCRPINRLREAARRFSHGEQLGELPVDRQDELGDLARTFQQMRDTLAHQFAELRHKQDELELLIRHDPLTGLPNRRLLNERLNQAIALTQRGNQGVALLFIDIDGFKSINDTRGHDTGDTVLVTVAQRLLEKVRVTDTVARLGGDEFVILLVGAPHHEAISAIAAGLVSSLGKPMHIAGQTLQVGASIGIALFPDDGASASELLVAADHAMYGVKRSGRAGYAFAGAKA